MKQFAISIDKTNGKEKEITAFEAIILRIYNRNQFNNLDFYYFANDGNKYKMSPKYRKETSTAFFAFYPKVKVPTNIKNEEGESLGHYIVKKALSKLSELKLHDTKENKKYIFKINPLQSKTEERYKFNNDIFRADVSYEISLNELNKNMRGYYYKWYGRLIIEVLVTHKVPQRKYQIFKDNNIPIFEVEINKETLEKFSLNNKKSLSKKFIETTTNNMIKMFEKEIRGTFISNPSSKEYLVMCKYKREIELFKKQKDKYESLTKSAIQEYEDINDALKKAKDELNRLENEKKSYEVLEREYNNLLKNYNDVVSEIKEYKDRPFRTIIKNRKK